MGYWGLVDAIWDAVSIYDGPEAFLAQYARVPEPARTLFAAHWLQSEVRNGGLYQFFCNSTGVLAPEAVEAFQKMGMPLTAAHLESAMGFFGTSYPRRGSDRERAIEEAEDARGEEWPGPFVAESVAIEELLRTENGGFRAAADSYARKHS